MKTRQMLYPVIFSVLTLFATAVWLVIVTPIDPAKHTAYEYLGSIATILGGLFGPIITIVGFLYLYLTFRDGRSQSRLNSIVTFMEKYEKRIDEELDRRMYNKKTYKNEPWETSVRQNIELSNPENIEIQFYYDEDCKSTTDMLSIFVEIKRNLYYLASYGLKAEVLGADSEIVNYYRLKYSDIVVEMDDPKRILGGAYFDYKKRTEISGKLAEIDERCRDFYNMSWSLLNE